MPCSQRRGIEAAGPRQQIRELDRLIAGDAGNGRFTRQVALDKAINDRLAEARLEVENIMWNAERSGGAAGIMDVLPRTARSLALYRRTMVVELQRDAHHLEARLLEQGGRDGGIDTPRHGADHADRRRVARQADRRTHTVNQGLPEAHAA